MASPRIPPIACLQAFEALARLHSVTQAAEELKAMIRAKYPDAQFSLSRAQDDRDAWDLWTFADIEDLDEIRDPDVKYPNQKKNGKLRCNTIGKNPSDVWQIAKVTSGADRSYSCVTWYTNRQSESAS